VSRRTRKIGKILNGENTMMNSFKKFQNSLKKLKYQTTPLQHLMSVLLALQGMTEPLVSKTNASKYFMDALHE
jgi:CDP-diacylglycerol pyrophosphatase